LQKPKSLLTKWTLALYINHFQKFIFWITLTASQVCLVSALRRTDIKYVIWQQSTPHQHSLSHTAAFFLVEKDRASFQARTGTWVEPPTYARLNIFLTWKNPNSLLGLEPTTVSGKSFEVNDLNHSATDALCPMYNKYYLIKLSKPKNKNLFELKTRCIKLLKTWVYWDYRKSSVL
jgi:hypothetical protein